VLGLPVARSSAPLTKFVLGSINGVIGERAMICKGVEKALSLDTRKPIFHLMFYVKSGGITFQAVSNNNTGLIEVLT
jgi:hypothetical protein